MRIKLIKEREAEHWDDYVSQHPVATLCHLYKWGQVIRDTYGHDTYNLLAEDEQNRDVRSIVGVLPLVHIKSRLFGNKLVSMPFLNYGGILADNEETEKLLLEEARSIGRQLGVKTIELRHIYPISWAKGRQQEEVGDETAVESTLYKVRMLLKLPESSTLLFDSFKSKLRSQVRKPQKEGLTTIIGGEDILDDYYHVFSINMRDLGSPVHSKRLFENILKEFGGRVKLGVVKHNETATAAGLIFCFRELVEIIWASSLKSFNHLSPNMLLYWSFLEYAADSKYKFFDFGRSTIGEGTYKFKLQWGAEPEILHWYEIATDNTTVERSKISNNDLLRRRGELVWQKTPILVANLIGPLIRKQISL